MMAEVFDMSMTSSDVMVKQQMIAADNVLLVIEKQTPKVGGFSQVMRPQGEFSSFAKFVVNQSLPTKQDGATEAQYGAVSLVEKMDAFAEAQNKKFPFDYLEGAQVIADVKVRDGFYNVTIKSFVDVPMMRQLATVALHD